MQKTHKLTLFMLVMIVFVSGGMLVSYSFIKKEAVAVQSDFYSDHVFIEENIINSNYAFYYKLLEQNMDQKLTPYDVFIKESGILLEGISKEEFNKTVQEWLRSALTGYSNLHYYVEDIKTGQNISNIEIDKATQALQQDYQFYTLFQYDEEGKIEFLQTYGTQSKIFEKIVIERSHAKRFSYTQQAQSMQPIRNTVYFYGIPKDIINIDYLTAQINTELSTGYLSVTNKVITLWIAIIIIGAVLCSYKTIKELGWFNKLIKIPTEIFVSLLGLIIIIQINHAPWSIEQYYDGFIERFLGIYIGKLNLPQMILNVIHFVQWGIYFGAVWIGIWLVKDMYYKGIFKFLGNYSLVGKCIHLIRNKIYRWIQKIRHLDIKQVNKSNVLNQIFILGTVMTICCTLWLFGIIGVIVYCMTIYSVVSAVLKYIQQDYKKLLQHTSHIAEGNLEGVMTQEDLGMFEPLKMHVTKIQRDFKHSIEEEMHSQKFKTDLITNVSHDLKTPLTSIVSYIDLLKQEGISEEQRKEYIDILERKASRLQILIEDLFEMSKASSGNIQLNKEKVELVALVKETLFELEDKISASDITFRTKFPQDKVYLMLDSARTFRIFENLISNITKYGCKHTRAYIQVEEDEQEVRIEMKNIAKEELNFDEEEITERFVRGDESRHTEGSGLGLAIAKSFVELQGGKLKISIDGDLFKVCVHFPIE